jgi:hypothetical protein
MKTIQRKEGKSSLQPKINPEVEEQIKTPKIDKPDVKGDLNISVFGLPKLKIENRKSIPKSQEDTEFNVSTP